MVGSGLARFNGQLNHCTSHAKCCAPKEFGTVRDSGNHTDPD
jgi:hypothetical protein